MAKKSVIWDDILTEKKPTLFKRISISIASWIAVFLFGIILLVALLWLAGLFIMPSSDYVQGLRIFIAYGMVAIAILVLSIRYARKRTDTLFFKYTQAPLKIGIAINILILTTALLLAVVDNVSHINHGGCRPLKDQLYAIQGATVPIATDIGTGTAFAVSDNNTLLTAYHVVKGAKKVYASYVSGDVSIEVIDMDPSLDLALLRISKPTMSHLKLTDQYDVGEPVYLNGYPGNAFNAGQASLSSGIISRLLNNSDLRLNDKKTPVGLELVQTDTATNPGNSGGALVSECGVVGVMVSVSSSDDILNQYGIRSEQGISYAVASKTAADRFNISIE